jgi:hypothetical protein
MEPAARSNDTKSSKKPRPPKPCTLTKTRDFLQMVEENKQARQEVWTEFQAENPQAAAEFGITSMLNEMRNPSAPRDQGAEQPLHEE